MGTGKEERFYYSLSEMELADAHPAIMARITDVKALLEMICLKEDVPEKQISGGSFCERSHCQREWGNWL